MTKRFGFKEISLRSRRYILYACVYLIPCHICELIAKLDIQTEEVRELLTVLTLPGGTEACSLKVGRCIVRILRGHGVISGFRRQCVVNSLLDDYYDQQLVNK